MAPSSNFFRASRPLFHQQSFAGTASRAGFRNPNFRAQFFRQGSKRWQSSAGAEGQAKPSWFQRMWDSPVGLKTVHFWAPTMKWAIVIAGISDFFRPAENLSVSQNCALTTTGFILTRWCLIIKPKNYLLATVNFFMGSVGLIQLSRIYMLEKSKKGSVVEAVEDMAKEVKESAPAAIKEKVA